MNKMVFDRKSLIEKLVSVGVKVNSRYFKPSKTELDVYDQLFSLFDFSDDDIFVKRVPLGVVPSSGVRLSAFGE